MCTPPCMPTDTLTEPCGEICTSNLTPSGMAMKRAVPGSVIE